jgi:hypothetical protein
MTSIEVTDSCYQKLDFLSELLECDIDDLVSEAVTEHFYDELKKWGEKDNALLI